MCGIETLIVLTMASFNFTIVSGSKGTDQLVFDTMLHETNLKNGGFIRTAIRTETFCEFLTIISLNALNKTWKCLDKMLEE